jgi:hypothetical protein
MTDETCTGYQGMENMLYDMPTKKIKGCLLQDMEMLRDGRWVPDDDSIDCHIDLIKELCRRTK